PPNTLPKANGQRRRPCVLHRRWIEASLCPMGQSVDAQFYRPGVTSRAGHRHHIFDRGARLPRLIGRCGGERKINRSGARGCRCTRLSLSAGLVATVGCRDTNRVRARIGISMRAAAPVRWTRLVTPVNERAPDGVLRGASGGCRYRERRRATAGRNRKRTAWRRIGGGSDRGRGRGSGGGEVDAVGYGDTKDGKGRVCIR